MAATQVAKRQIFTTNMTLDDVQTVTGAKTFNPGTLNVAANTATVAQLNLASVGGVLKTTPVAGDFETDTRAQLYYSMATSSRGAVDVEQFLVLNTAFTLTSQTAAQKLFNNPTNGALTVTGSTMYFFECVFSLSAMSATNNSFGFAIGGTATLTSIAWDSSAMKATLATAGTPSVTYNVTNSNTALTGSTTNTVGYARIFGVIKVNAAGTIIPQVSLQTAAAAIVGVNSRFRIWPVGTNAVLSLGAWT